MKKLLLGLCIFICSASLAQSKYLSFKDGYVSQRKFNTPQKTITNGDSYIDVEYNFDGAYIKLIKEEENKGYVQMYMDNSSYIADRMVFNYSCERLPLYKDIIVLPANANESTVEIEMIEQTYNDYKCPLNEKNPSVFLDEKNYKKADTEEQGTNFNPEVQAYVVSKGSFRDMPFITINTYPVAYDLYIKTVRCYSKLKYRIKFKEKDTKAKITQLAYNVFAREASNPEILMKYDTSLLSSEAKLKTCDYLIVTKDEYKAAAEKLASWKNRLGYKCHILSHEKWVNEHPGIIGDSIRAFCSNLTFYPDYLLIIGSHDDVPTFRAQAPGAYSTDLPLTEFQYHNGNYYDDMVKGRISVYSAEEANTVVDKIISYEQNPPTDSDFYNSVLTISYFQHDGQKKREDKTMDFLSSAEGINIDLKNLGYNIDRHYVTGNKYNDDNSSNCYPQYFNNGVRMSDEMFMKDINGNDFWDKDPSEITDIINEGRSIVIYRGHGDRTKYCHNAYTQKDVAELRNGNKTPVFFNFTCNTGSFHYDGKGDSLCFAECLLNKKDGGAVGVFANTDPTIHYESNLLGASTMNALFKNQEISIATAILQATLKTEYFETREIAHYFGDPSMRLYTVEPATFKPFINRGSDNSITVDSHVKGSKITVCSIADYGKSYFKTFDASDETRFVFENVTVPCYITITKANYVPYVTVSKTDLYLQNMTLTGYHDIVANNIISGEKVTKETKEGAFVVERGMTKLRSSKTLSLKSGTSVKNGASLRARKGDSSTLAYKGDGKPRSVDFPLCFSSYSDRFITDDQFVYENNNGPLSSISDNESNSNSVKIYPNPTSGRINVAVNNGNNINDIVVLDITGNVLMSESVNADKVSIDLSSFAKGIYLVKVVTAEDSFVKKVVLK